MMQTSRHGAGDNIDKQTHAVPWLLDLTIPDGVGAPFITSVDTKS